MSIDLKSLFNTDSLYYYRQFIKSFFIGGVKPEKIQNFKESKPRTSRKINSEDCPEECPVEAIVCIPSKELKSYNSTTMNVNKFLIFRCFILIKCIILILLLFSWQL